MLKDASGRELDTRDDIENEIISFYIGLFGSEESTTVICFENYPGTKIDSSEHHLLSQLPTRDSIKKVVWDIGNNKASGPDGFGSWFFKDSWNIVETNVRRAVLEFFRIGKMLKQLNTTFVSLIPEVDKPFLVKEYRPISCCNTMLKIISKIPV